MFSHLDEVLFDLDGPGQGLHVRGLHLQFFLLRGHNRLESSELPLGTEEEVVKTFKKPKPQSMLLPHLSLGAPSWWRGSKSLGKGTKASPLGKGNQHRLKPQLTLLSLSFFAISSSSSLALTRSFSSSIGDAVSVKTARLRQGHPVPAAPADLR